MASGIPCVYEQFCISPSRTSRRHPHSKHYVACWLVLPHRAGLNLVAGSNPTDQGQMGLWRDLDHGGRYRLAKEWITVAKRLWTEERVDHKGEFYELTDCMSNPKPAKVPPIICAGASDSGFRFTAAKRVDPS